MKLQILAVYDSKAGAYSAPFFQHTIAMAIRAFVEAVNMPEHPVAKNPEDYSLFHLGSWDDESGVFAGLPETKNLGRAANFKKE